MWLTRCVCGVGRVYAGGAGGEYVLSVLRSSASEAQKVEALRTAGIQSAKGLSLLGEWCWYMKSCMCVPVCC